MEFDGDTCYRALVTRDARFDGAFFVGVKTTGIYCRPVCPARTPRRERCDFFARAALAERAGFRACFRCRPERAPGRSNVDAVSRLVARAVRLVDEGALNDGSVERLAGALGVSARHVRRAMQNELGVSPIELALSKRIGLARELLLGTALSVAEIAFACGFSSVRRFNDAYRKSQRMTPSSVRRPNAHRADDAVIRMAIDVRAPFDPDSAFGFMRARAIAGSESFVGDTYVRAVSMNGAVGTVAIRARAGGIACDVSPSLSGSLMKIATRLRRLFDADADTTSIAAHLSRDPVLRARVRTRPALRVMGAFDPFEWAIRAVLGQQISVRGARTIAGRLVATFGVPLPRQTDERLPAFAWPDAARLAEADVDALRAIGLTRARASTVLALARAVASGAVVLDEGAEPEITREALLAIPGIGPWTAQYIELRALGWPDAFPAGDLGLRNALGGISTTECEARAETWKPWRAYAAAHLWTGLSEENA